MRLAVKAKDLRLGDRILTATSHVPRLDAHPERHDGVVVVKLEFGQNYARQDVVLITTDPTYFRGGSPSTWYLVEREVPEYANPESAKKLRDYLTATCRLDVE